MIASRDSDLRIWRFGLIALLAVLVWPLLLWPAPAQGAATDWAESEQGRLRLIAASDGVDANGALRLGLHFEMAEDWKIYWRAPGDAGYPPRVDWRGSRNLESAEILWPVPHRFQLFGMQTFGYGKQIVLPIRARAKNPDQPVTVKARVDYLTCADICVPVQATFEMLMLPGLQGPSEHAHLLDRYRARVPGHGAEAGLTLTRAALNGPALTGPEDAPTLALAVTSQTPLDAPDAVVEGAAGVSFGKPEVTLSDGGTRAELRLSGTVETEGAGDALAGAPITVTVFDGARRGLTREIVPQAGALDDDAAVLAGGDASGRGGSGGTTSSGTTSGGGGGVAGGGLAGILALAVLGGLILNLMPCVLPVLSLKLLSVVSYGGAARHRIRAGFLASAAGIVFSFLVLASVLIGLKSAGLAIGWGIQFQQPAFIVAMTLVVALFAFNLLGLFEIQLPRALARPAESLAGGGTAPEQEGLAGHFATGAFATLLATPCSAPFLGTAVAFALARGIGEILAVFLALGLGLALPYLVVAAVPGVARAMPRPGRWMLTVKKVLAVALIATGVWLLSVLAAESGLVPALAVGAAVALGGVLVGQRGRLAALAGGWIRPVLPGLLVMLAAGAFAAPMALESAPMGNSAAADGGWRPLDRAEIDSLVAEDKVVFVDVTADWCITCKVNKAAVIDSEAVGARLDREGVVRMRGDWTRPDDAISDYLASFDRYGIPFNAVYGPSAPAGKVLPELLSRQGVLDAIDSARGGNTS